MKTIIAKTLLGTDVKIRFNERNLKVHSSDYTKLNEENFKVYNEGNGFVEFEVNDRIIKKTYPTWITDGKCNIVD